MKKLQKQSTISKQKKTIPTILLEEKAKLIVSSTALNEISYLHHKIGSTEWSGIALINVKGDLDNIGELKCIVEHVYPNNIGSGHFTSYNSKDSKIHLDILKDIPEAEDLKLGFVHSHHSMDTFFSGTDTSELVENSENYNWLLSLIVNFANDYSARIAFRGTREIEVSGNTKSKLFFKNRFGKYISKVDNKDNTQKIKQDVVFMADFDIEIESESEWLNNRISKLFKVKKEEEIKRKNQYQNSFGFQKSLFRETDFKNYINNDDDIIDRLARTHIINENKYHDIELCKKILINSLSENDVKIIKDQIKNRGIYINDIVNYLNDQYDTPEFSADEIGNGYINNKNGDIEEIKDYVYAITKTIQTFYDNENGVNTDKVKFEDYVDSCLESLNVGLIPYQNSDVIRHLTMHVNDEINDYIINTMEEETYG